MSVRKRLIFRLEQTENGLAELVGGDLFPRECRRLGLGGGIWAPFEQDWAWGIDPGDGCPARGSGFGNGESLGWSEAGEEGEIVGEDRGPDIGLEVVEAAPSALAEAIGAFQA